MTDTITLPREVVQFMLQHLEWWNDDEPQEKEAIAALRKALAAEQPKQEPGLAELARQMKPLDADMAAILQDNLDSLYIEDEPALAAEQPKPEPVAWRPRLSPNLCFHWSRPWSPGVPSEQTVDYWNQKGAGVEYAYAAPPALAAEQPKPSEDIETLRRENERLKAVAFQAQDAAIYLAKQNERMAADSALLVFGAVNERAVQMTQRRDQGEACSYPRCPNDGGRCARLFAGQCSGPREADPQQVPR